MKPTNCHGRLKPLWAPGKKPQAIICANNTPTVPARWAIQSSVIQCWSAVIRRLLLLLAVSAIGGFDHSKWLHVRGLVVHILFVANILQRSYHSCIFMGYKSYTERLVVMWTSRKGLQSNAYPMGRGIFLCYHVVMWRIEHLCRSRSPSQPTVIGIVAKTSTIASAHIWAKVVFTMK